MLNAKIKLTQSFPNLQYSEDFGQYAPTSLSLYSHFHEIYLLKVYYIESQLEMAVAPAQTQREGHCGFTLLGHEVTLVEVQF